MYVLCVYSLMVTAVMRLNVIFSLSLYQCDSIDREIGISFPEILIVSLYT